MRSPSSTGCRNFALGPCLSPEQRFDRCTPARQGFQHPGITGGGPIGWPRPMQAISRTRHSPAICGSSPQPCSAPAPEMRWAVEGRSEGHKPFSWVLPPDAKCGPPVYKPHQENSSAAENAPQAGPVRNGVQQIVYSCAVEGLLIDHAADGWFHLRVPEFTSFWNGLGRQGLG